MTVTIQKDGKTIRTSKNLRGIMDYARGAHLLPTILTQTGEDQRTLQVRFYDGAVSTSTFADAAVLAGWIENRVRYGRGKFKKGTS